MRGIIDNIMDSVPNVMHINSYEPGVPFVGHRQTSIAPDVTPQPQALDDWTFFFFFFFFCIFTRLETLTIYSCNYFTFETFSINPQSTLVYGLLY